MSTTRAFAYNDGPTIPYTTQVGNIAIGNDNTIDYSLNYGGVIWWEGPYETYGYVIAVAVSDNSQPTPIGVSPSGASIQFKRSTDLTDASLITLINEVFNQSFTDISNALIWLDNNGHWTSYNNTPSTPTPTPSNTQLGTTPTPTPSNTQAGTTPTPTPTNTQTPTNTVTPTPTNTQTPTNTVTPTPSNTQAGTTPTPTPTPTNASTGFMTISEVGSNVVMTASGTIDLDGLTLVQANTGPYGGGGLGVSSATYLMGTTGVNFDEYSGFTTNPTNFGSGGGGGANITSGDVFGVIMQGAPPYLLILPSGYISGTNISSSQTFTGQTFSSLGLTPGTYTYTWGSGKSLSVVIGASVTPTPTPTPSRGSAGSGSWYFYSDEGTINVGAPTANGNAIFLIQGSPIVETFNPNKNSGTSTLYFDVKDSVGTDYTTQFSGLTNGGTISITQNGDTARYTANSAGAFMVVNNGGGNYFFMLNAGVATQTQTSSNKFTYADPISITFGS